MNRSTRSVLAIVAAMAIAVATAIPALAAAPGPKGTLTALEYKQLLAEQAQFKKLKHDKRLTINDLYAACHLVGQSTELARSVRDNCVTGLGVDQSLVGFYRDVTRCAALSTSTTTTPTTTTTTASTTTTSTTTTATGTTTTGTTTTGTLSASDFKLLACMQPEYAVIARALKAIDTEQLKLRDVVLARHFSARCVSTLAPSIKELRVLKHFASTGKQLSADINQITKVANGTAPSSSVNDSQVEADSLAFDSAARQFDQIKRPQNLSVCQHQ